VVDECPDGSVTINAPMPSELASGTTSVYPPLRWQRSWSSGDFSRQLLLSRVTVCGGYGRLIAEAGSTHQLMLLGEHALQYHRLIHARR
jgi:hypothetical protein